MKIMPVQKQTRAGQRTRFKAFVVVGDCNGHIGLGVKCAKEVATAIRGALILAKLSVIPVRRGYWGNKIGKPHTVPTKVTGKCGSVTVRLVPAPRGSGIVAARVPKKVLQFAGIEDVFTSSRGSTKTLGNFVKATFACLLNTYTFLTPDLWHATKFTKTPFQEFTDFLAKPHKLALPGATFACLLNTYAFLTPDLWHATKFTKTPFQEFTDFLAKPHKLALPVAVPDAFAAPPPAAAAPVPARLEGGVAEFLEADWTEQEVKKAFAAMAKNKSPGGDGLPKELFEAHWDLLGSSFMAMVKDFEKSATLPVEIKEAVTILLHKKGERDQLNNYRPITLLNFSYKVLARVIADRMKAVLHQVISPEQCGFLPGKRLSDAVALVADMIDAAKNGNEDWFLLLVDFQKAFDSVSRDYLFQVLRRMGFSNRFVEWIEGLHKDTKTRLLVNGWLGEGMDVISGVRQGCPLAPYLFLCAVEPLAQAVEREELGLSREGQRLGYLGYADDTTLALQGAEQIKKAEKLLDDFEKVSGLATNKSKSVILPLGANLGATDSSSVFKWAGGDEAERLLGVWVSPSGSGLPTWEKALEHMSGKLLKWQLKYLTTSARATVVNCYITPIVAFQAQVYPPPVEVWVELTRLLHGFISGNKVTTARGFVLWSKELVHTTRAAGGIGVRDPGIVLTCLAARRVGLFLTETNSLKKYIMTQAADLPMGTDTFTAHEKLLKHWTGRSVRWRQTCESLLQSPLCARPTAVTREEILQERIAFSTAFLLNGTTPLGGQKVAQGLWKVRLGDLLEQDADGGLAQRSVEELSLQFGGSALARMALKVLSTIPAPWLKVLGFPTVLPRSADSTPQLPILENGQVIALKRMRECWTGFNKESYKREKWAARWGESIDWKRAVDTRDSLAVPSRPRDVLLRIHGLNLQVGERLAFLSSKPICPYCGGEETREHCLVLCPRIQMVTSALKRALSMLNPNRTITSLGDLLFRATGTNSAFPELTLTTITFHQLWLERCDAVFRGSKFRTQRVLRKIEFAFRQHAKRYSRKNGVTWRKQNHRCVLDERDMLQRIKLDGKEWKWTNSFAAIWLHRRARPIRP
ncbi:unnamed protein product [Closterium sp. NIES-65]|nr:unnamed protein product [Closterium sp. NIES-65]